MMEVFWTILASQDRKRIREYIAEQNLMAAIELDERIGYSASSLAGLTWEGLAHSAIADARMTAGVVNAIAAYHLELLQEQARLKNLKRIIWLK